MLESVAKCGFRRVNPLRGSGLVVLKIVLAPAADGVSKRGAVRDTSVRTQGASPWADPSAGRVARESSLREEDLPENAPCASKCERTPVIEVMYLQGCPLVLAPL